MEGQGPSEDAGELRVKSDQSPAVQSVQSHQEVETNNFNLLRELSSAQSLPEFNKADSSQAPDPLVLRNGDNESLIAGFALLRALQLLNVDIYYIGLEPSPSKRAHPNRPEDVEVALGPKVSPVNATVGSYDSFSSDKRQHRTILDELASYNPLQKFIDRYELLSSFCRFLKICLSLMAITIGFDKTISTILLCLLANRDPKHSESNSHNSHDSTDNNDNNIDSNHDDETTSSGMGLFVLIGVNVSSIYILFSTVFNGHLLWNLLSHRLFLVGPSFQLKTMLFLSAFIYIEYMVNISFISNLYEWESNKNGPQLESYSVFTNLTLLVTEQDFGHYYVDLILKILQFSRGIIRISPYITINYTIICLSKHISAIRNQQLLTESLKRRQKLRLVVVSGQRKVRRAFGGRRRRFEFGRRRRISFIAERLDVDKGKIGANSNQQLSTSNESLAIRSKEQKFRRMSFGNIMTNLKADEPTELASNSISFVSRSNSSLEFESKPSSDTGAVENGKLAANEVGGEQRRSVYSLKIRNFDELEAYITNLYMFTGRLNRFMSLQGLTVFFIVHNLLISASLIVPGAIKGGLYMVYLIRLLLIGTGIVPFIFGQSLNSQLEQLSKQVDRIIIKQHFIYRRRDNLVRIRELIKDICVNCGGMLNFNVEAGIKYLVLALASAFFIEQERKYKTEGSH